MVSPDEYTEQWGFVYRYGGHLIDAIRGRS